MIIIIISVIMESCVTRDILPLSISREKDVLIQW